MSQAVADTLVTQERVAAALGRWFGACPAWLVNAVGQGRPLGHLVRDTRLSVVDAAWLVSLLFPRIGVEGGL